MKETAIQQLIKYMTCNESGNVNLTDILSKVRELEYVEREQIVNAFNEGVKVWK